MPRMNRRFCVAQVYPTQVDDYIGHGSQAADSAQRGVDILSGFLISLSLVVSALLYAL